jgi:hypothetical protein
MLAAFITRNTLWSHFFQSMALAAFCFKHFLILCIRNSSWRSHRAAETSSSKFQRKKNSVLHVVRPLYIHLLLSAMGMGHCGIHTGRCGLGISRPTLNQWLCHHHRCLDTTHYAILICYLYEYYPFHTVLAWYLTIHWHYNINIAHRNQHILLRRVHKLVQSKYYLRPVCESFCSSICSHGTTRLPLKGFQEIWNLCIFRKSVE